MILDRFSLAGKVALVTGSGRGIGQGIAMAFADAGADVVCAARTAATIEAVAADIRAIGRRSLSIPCDVRDGQQVEVLVAETMREFGRLDILVNNAGAGGFRMAMTVSERTFEAEIRENLVSTFLCIKAAAKAMLEQKSGSIINISSRQSQMPGIGQMSYAAAKAGVNSLTRTLAWELAPYIRVNAILPGPVDVPSNAATREQMKSQCEQITPLKRVGKPDDIALAAIYLASSASDWVTGKLLEVDGGIEFSALTAMSLLKRD